MSLSIKNSHFGPRPVINGLVSFFDAANLKSYPGPKSEIDLTNTEVLNIPILISNNNEGTIEFGIKLTSNDNDINTYYLENSTQILDVGEIAIIFLTWSGNEYRIYNNGNLINQTTINILDIQNGSVKFINKNDETPIQFSFFKYYDIQLNESQIFQNYVALKSRFK